MVGRIIEFIDYVSAGLLEEDVAKPRLTVGVDPLRNSTLVCHHHEPKTTLLQAVEGFRHTRQNFKIAHAVGIIRIVSVQNTIAIKKHTRTHRYKMQSLWILCKKNVLQFLLILEFTEGK
jgi:hypothetical protein